MDSLQLAISAIFVNNILLAQYLGHCPFCGVSKQIRMAAGMGMAVVFVMFLASIFTWSAFRWLLDPFGVDFMRTLVFILIIASLVQLVEIIMKRFLQGLYRSLGIFLPLLATNCAVMGVALLNVNKQLSATEMLVFSLSSGVGWALAIILFAGIRERLAICPVPQWMQGTALALVTAGIMSLAFMGFLGMAD